MNSQYLMYLLIDEKIINEFCDYLDIDRVPY